MNLEVGMYVRTHDGEIAKIINDEWANDEDGNCDKLHIEFEFDKYIWQFESRYLNEYEYGIGDYERWFKKVSFNPLDLIEPMDLLFIDISPDDCGGIVVPRIAETMVELNDIKYGIEKCNWILKRIVTKERIQANWYEIAKVNGEI